MLVRVPTSTAGATGRRVKTWLAIMSAFLFRVKVNGEGGVRVSVDRPSIDFAADLHSQSHLLCTVVGTGTVLLLRGDY